MGFYIWLVMSGRQQYKILNIPEVFMAVAANKRSVMTLFSGPTDIYSHQVRIVLAEKGVSFEIEHVEKDNPPQDRLTSTRIKAYRRWWIVSSLCGNPASLWRYLDERFPHPPLMPVYPVARGESRLYMQRIEKDWYSLMNTIQSGTAAQADACSCVKNCWPSRRSSPRNLTS